MWSKYMSIATIGSAHVMPVSSEKAEGPGPDHDGDADDAGAKAPVQAAPPPGTGAAIDKTA
jgi:hypothetical protein